MKRVMFTRTLLICFSAILGLFLLGEKVSAASDIVSWGYETIGINDFLEKLDDQDVSEEIVIAVIDSGIDTDHEWFENRIIDGGANCLNKSGTCLPGGYEDDNGHGTHVSGIIAKGTPENVKILPIKVLNSKSKGWVVDFVAAIEYVVSLKNQGINIRAINFSISSEKQPVGSGWNKKYEEAFQHAYDAGILSVVAAGNNAADVATISPANLENVITVSALTQGESEPYFSSSFSNYGDTIDFAAPGDNIYSAKKGGGVRSMWGTSMATPHVSTSIALLYSVCSNCTPEVVENILKETATDAGTPGKDQYYGMGIINMKLAYSKIVLQKLHKIEFKSSGNGIVNFLNCTEIRSGEDRKITFSPSIGYEVKKIVIDGKTLNYTELIKARQYGYTFTNITEDHTIEVTFAKKMYAINSSTQGNGKINLLGKVSVEYGGAKRYVFIPKIGYKVAKVIIDGRALEGNELVSAIKNGYTFNNVKKSHSIKVVFEKTSYIITSSVQGNGRASQLGNISVTMGSRLTIRFAPRLGSKIVAILVDGKLLTWNELQKAINYGYTFINVNANHTIRVVFQQTRLTSIAYGHHYKVI